MTKTVGLLGKTNHRHWSLLNTHTHTFFLFLFLYPMRAVLVKSPGKIDKQREYSIQLLNWILGDASQLYLGEHEKPVPKDHEVLVKVSYMDTLDSIGFIDRICRLNVLL